MNFAVLGTVFGLIFLAELPDKTALASLVLGTRYRPLHVWTGAASPIPPPNSCPPLLLLPPSPPPSPFSAAP